MKGSSQNGKATESQPDVHGPKTEEDVMAEERTTKLKEEKEKEGLFSTLYYFTVLVCSPEWIGN